MPDLIKEILTGSGESKAQVGCQPVPEITKDFLCWQEATSELGSGGKLSREMKSLVRMRISQFEGGCLPLSAEKQTAEKKIDNSDN